MSTCSEDPDKKAKKVDPEKLSGLGKGTAYGKKGPDQTGQGKKKN